MKLSILTLCCDKDWQCMSYLLNTIETVYKSTNKSFDSYEVIVADNRDQYASENVDWSQHEYVTVLPNNPKRMQYTARREQARMCNGDYIWFVDGDDLITHIPEVRELTDIIGFSYFVGTDEQNTAIDTLYTRNDVSIRRGLSITDTKHSDSGFTKEASTYVLGSAIMLWPKIFTRRVVLEALKILPEDMEIISGEDLLLWVACLAKARSISYYNKPCYFYNCANSLNHKSTFTLKQYSRMIKGVDDTFNILQDLKNRNIISCTDKWLNIAARNHCYVFAGKVLLVEKEEDRIEAMRLLLNIYSSRTIETSIIRYYLNTGISDRRTLLITLLELDKLLTVGEPTDPKLDYLVKELGYAD